MTAHAICHDHLAGYNAAEHIDWTAAAADFNTSGTGTFGSALHISGDFAELYMASTNQGEYTGAARLMFMAAGMAGQPANTKCFALNNQNGSTTDRLENKWTLQSRNDDGSYKDVLVEVYQDSKETHLRGLLNIEGNAVPRADNAYDLGSISQEWRNLYVDGIGNIDTLYGGSAVLEYSLQIGEVECEDGEEDYIYEPAFYVSSSGVEIGAQDMLDGYVLSVYGTSYFFDTPYFYTKPQFLQGAWFHDNDCLYMGSSSDVEMYYNGTHNALIIKSDNPDAGVSCTIPFWVQLQNTGTDGYHPAVHVANYMKAESATSGQYSGATLAGYFQSDYDHTASYGVRGANLGLIFDLAASGNVVSAVGCHAILLENSSNYTGTITDFYSFLGRNNVTGGSQVDITNFHGFYHEEINRPGAAYNYGLHLENVTGGTHNYAIYTNQGQIRFGDDVYRGSNRILTERQINADFANTANTGDTDTDDLINALVTALSNHGLIAAS